MVAAHEATSSNTIFAMLLTLDWRWMDHKEVDARRFVRDMVVAVVSVLFSILSISWAA